MKISCTVLSDAMGIDRLSLTRNARKFSKTIDLMKDIKIVKIPVGNGRPRREYMFTEEQAYYLISRSSKSKNIVNKLIMSKIASHQKGGFLNE